MPYHTSVRIRPSRSTSENTSLLRARVNMVVEDPISQRGTHVAEPNGVDGPGLYGRALVRLRHPVREVGVEVGHPLEPAFREAPSELASHPPRVVEALLGPPPAAALEPRGAPRPGGGRESFQRPFCRGPLEPFPGELDHYQGSALSEQGGDLVQGSPEVPDVVQGQARHHAVERTGIGERLDAHATEDGTLRRPRIDGGHGVARKGEGAGQLPLPATHLQHPGGRVTDLPQDELLDAPPPTVGPNHEVHSRSAPLKNTATTVAAERKVSIPTEPMALPDAQLPRTHTSRTYGE